MNLQNKYKLTAIADKLDNFGFVKEANKIDNFLSVKTLQEKPIIGIMSRIKTIDEDYDYVERRYSSPLFAYNAIPLIIPSENDFINDIECLDGIVFPGGLDLYPGLSNEPVRKTVTYDKKYDEREILLFLKAMDIKMPTLGICKGIQVFNLALGGTIKDLSNKYLKHNNNGNFVVHNIKISPSSMLHSIFSNGDFDVYSAHHQHVDSLGVGVIPVAWSEDGCIEAIEIKGNNNILGLQFHPEAYYLKNTNYSIEEFQTNVFKWLVDLSIKNMKRS